MEYAKGRTHTPVRRYEIERTGPVIGEVKTTKWTKEELEAYFRTLPPPPEKRRLKYETTAKQRKMRRV